MKETKTAETVDLTPKNKINLSQAIFMTIGATMGTGVFIYTGMSIRSVGTFTPLAYLCAALLVVFTIFPSLVLSSTIPATGGSYMYVSRFLHPIVGYVQIVSSIFTCMSLAVMCITAAGFVQALFPSWNLTVIGLVVCLGVIVTTWFGIKTSAIVQQIEVIALLISFVVFYIAGIPRFDPTLMDFGKIFQLHASFAASWATIALLRNSVRAGTGIATYAEEVENPGKNVPLAILIGISVAALLYAGVAYVLLGCAPMDALSGKMMAETAHYVTGENSFAFYYFMTCGGLLATLTTLISMFLMQTRLNWRAAADGIWPKIFTKTNKYGTPSYMLGVVSVICLIVVAFNLDIESTVKITTLPALLIGILFYIAVLKIPNRFPYSYRSCYLHMPKWLLYAITIISMVLTAYMSFALILSTDKNALLGALIFYGAAMVYFVFRNNYLKKHTGSDLIQNMKGMHPMWVQHETELREKAENKK